MRDTSLPRYSHNHTDMAAQTSTDILQKTTQTLSEVWQEEEQMNLRTGSILPSNDDLKELMLLIKGVVFPGFFDRSRITERTRLYHTGVAVEKIYCILKDQIAKGLVFCCDRNESTVSAEAKKLALKFISGIPEIKRLMLTDVAAVAHNDPAVTNFGEVVFSYPVISVMLHYRAAHALLELGVPIIPRIITELAHSETGIDIHPAAKIGEYFSIDHGTGVVIGATSIIGNHVMLYQGVTLGAKNFKYDENGLPMNVPRHPIIEDNVTVYSNTSILGRVTIGHDTIIGGNIWLTHDVPPHSRLLQSKAMYDPGFSDGAGI